MCPAGSPMGDGLDAPHQPHTRETHLDRDPLLEGLLLLLPLRLLLLRECLLRERDLRGEKSFVGLLTKG